MHLATAEFYDGSLADARDLYRQALELSRSIGDLESEVMACGYLGNLGLVAGDAELTGTGLSRCIEIGERLGEGGRVGAQAQLGTHLLQSGEVDAARDTLERARSRSLGVMRFAAIRISHVFAAALLASGDAARAESVAQESLDECLEIGARVTAAEIALLLSSVLRARLGVAAGDRVEELAKLAEELIAKCGARNLSAWVEIERAELCALRGDAAGRVAHLRAAHADFERMEATIRVHEIDRALRTAKAVHAHSRHEL